MVLGMEGFSKFEGKGKEPGFCCKDETLELSRPDRQRLLFLFFMKDFLKVIVRVNGDSSILKFKFDFLIKFITASLVDFPLLSELIQFF